MIVFISFSMQVLAGYGCMQRPPAMPCRVTTTQPNAPYLPTSS